MRALQISYRMLRDSDLFRLELFPLFWVDFSSIYVGFFFFFFYVTPEFVGAFRRAQAISGVKPICRLVFYRDSPVQAGVRWAC